MLSGSQALQRLRTAGIPTRADSRAGEQEYINLRSTWELDIEAVAPALGYRMEEVDRAVYSARPNAALNREVLEMLKHEKPA